jgi:hypothetical protein
MVKLKSKPASGHHPSNMEQLKGGGGGPGCQKFGKTFRPVGRKNWVAEKKIRPPTEFDYVKEFGLIKLLLSVRRILKWESLKQKYSRLRG